MHNSTQNKITKKTKKIEFIWVKLSSSLMSKLETWLESKLGYQSLSFTSLNVRKKSIFESSLVKNVQLKLEKAQKVANKTWAFWLKLKTW